MVHNKCSVLYTGPMPLVHIVNTANKKNMSFGNSYQLACLNTGVLDRMDLIGPNGGPKRSLFWRAMSLGFRSYNNILETASWLGKYLYSFVIDSEEVESWHSLRDPLRKGKLAVSLNTMSCLSINEVLTHRNVSIFIVSQLRDLASTQQLWNWR